MRFISFLPSVTVSRINPANKLRNPSNTIALAKIAVGNLGTSPVSKYSLNIGATRKIDVTASKTNIEKKNCKGRSSFTSNPIVFRILNPSLYVFNLLSEPSGLSL